LLPGSRNAARGSWTLLNAANQVALQGIWSAEKSARGWRGTWSARIGTGRSPVVRSSGQSFSGTWQTDVTDTADKTFADLLQRAVVTQVGGAWTAAQRKGRWTLQALR
jgi:hypothetical protein